MVRHGVDVIHFRDLVVRWDNKGKDTNHPCKFYHFWKSVKFEDRWLETFPERFRQKIRERWWWVNGIRFLELVPE